MGIKGLWTVLTPFSEKKSLHEIKGETVAVDLSGWICDSQNVTEYHIQPRLYLRNLFFRTVYLLLADIKPIFVLEGDAPELKRDVMVARNAIQFRGAAPKQGTGAKKKPDVTRKRFQGVLRECEVLLKSMGVCCIKGRGEAEATCAQLNAQCVVDAVVSQDSDCFAYGARRVYRNFSVSNSAGGGALQGSVDSYDATHMFEQNGFGRNKMVALALLCGCDYGVGVCGSSITTVISFLHTIPELDVIPRLLSWVSETEVYEEKQRWISAPGRCDRCGHGGRTHGRNGCPTCATHRGCNDTGHKSKLADMKRELSLRNRALSCGVPFPEPQIMKEFLNNSPEILDLKLLDISAPSLVQFMKLMRYKLEWSERYCVEKFLPILTRWHLQENVACRTIQPVTIKKKRVPRGVPSYEVIWNDINGQYNGLIPDDQFEDDEDPLLPWTTLERQDLMRTYYGELVDAYEESIKKPSKEKKTRKGTKGRKKKDIESIRKKNNHIDNGDDIDDVNRSLNDMSIKVKNKSLNKSMVTVKVNKLKRKFKSHCDKANNQKTIDSFLPKRRKSIKKLMKSIRNSFRNISITDNEVNDEIDYNLQNKENLATNNVNNSLSLFDLSCDNINENDLSDILDNIVSAAPATKTATINNKLVKLVFTKNNSTPKRSTKTFGKTSLKNSILCKLQNNCSTPNNSPIRKKSLNANFSISENVHEYKINTSYFFDKLTDKCDAFEMSIEDINRDHDRTVNYSFL